MISQIIINLIVPLFFRKKHSPSNNMVYFSPAYKISGIICALFFSILICICIYEKEDIWVIIAFAVFVFLGIYLILFSSFWLITYTDKYFIYRSMFGRVTKVQYADIIKIKRKEDVRLYTEKKRYFIDRAAIGFDEFIEIISQKVWSTPLLIV